MNTKKYKIKKCTGIMCLLLILFATGAVFQLRAQEPILASERFPELRYYSLKGEVFYSAYIQIKGSAFMEDDWMKGDILLNNGKTIRNVSFKLDAYAHRVLVYQDYLKRIITVSKSDISEFFIKNGKKERRFIFIKDISSKAKVSDGCYFEELSSGKISCYKLYYKDVLPLRAPEMPLLDEFIDETSYFLKYGDHYESIRLNRNILYKTFPQYKTELKQFVHRKNLHLKQENDFVTAISYLSEVLELIAKDPQ
jgi:hypothetical protein